MGDTFGLSEMSETESHSPKVNFFSCVDRETDVQLGASRFLNAIEKDGGIWGVTLGSPHSVSRNVVLYSEGHTALGQLPAIWVTQLSSEFLPVLCLPSRDAEAEQWSLP